MIISLSGYATSGKDSVADILAEDYGFIKYAWADSVRLAAQALNPIVGIVDEKIVRYNDALDILGYTVAKAELPEFRRILQYIGTEVGRELIGDDVWVSTTLRRIEREHSLKDNIVITDTRFHNEADAVRNASGVKSGGKNFLVRVHRPDVGPASDHPSETQQDEIVFDYHLHNDGSLDDLRNSVKTLYSDMKSPSRG